MIPSLRLFCRKRAGGESPALFGKGIMSLMGYNKNYIMYWGGVRVVI